MIIRSYQNAVDFLARTQTILEENEVLNSLMLGLCMRLSKTPNHKGTIYRSVHDEHGLIAATMHTPGRGVLVYQHRVDATDAFSMIVADYYQNQMPPYGVIGPQKSALRFAQLWQVVSGDEPEIFQHQCLYQCTSVSNFDLAPGKLRKALKKEIPMLIDWSMEFSDITTEKPSEEEIKQSLNKDIDEGTLYVWSDGSQAVTMLKENRPTSNTVAVSYVFTPKELRQRGYATAAVHSLTRQLLASGYAACTLYTDMHNPTSNKIYQKIGYQPVADFDNYVFQPKKK